MHIMTIIASKDGKKFEKIIDSMPEIDWDFNFKKILSNPHYNPPEIEKNDEWLIDLIYSAFKMCCDNLALLW